MYCCNIIYLSEYLGLTNKSWFQRKMNNLYALDFSRKSLVVGIIPQISHFSYRWQTLGLFDALYTPVRFRLKVHTFFMRFLLPSTLQRSKTFIVFIENARILFEIAVQGRGIWKRSPINIENGALQERLSHSQLMRMRKRWLGCFIITCLRVWARVLLWTVKTLWKR